MSRDRGVGNVAREAKQRWRGVGNVAREIKEGWRGVGNVARQYWSTGTPASSLAVGSSVWLNVDGVKTEFLVVNQGNPDSSLYDSSCNGTWLLIKDCYGIGEWSVKGYGNKSYKDSDLHTEVNTTFINKLDPIIKEAIKQVKIPYAIMKVIELDGEWWENELDTMMTGANGLSTRAFLLSGYECGYEWSNLTHPMYPDADGAKLSYFELGRTSTSAKNLRKCVLHSSGGLVKWWLRCSLYLSMGGADVSTDGSFSNAVTSADFGLRPAFILPSDFQFTDDMLKP